MPPKLLRSCSSFTTGVIIGDSGRPLSCGYSIGSPKRLAKASCCCGVDLLVAQEDHEMVEAGVADFVDDLVVEFARHVDAADLRAQRAGRSASLRCGGSCALS